MSAAGTIYWRRHRPATKPENNLSWVRFLVHVQPSIRADEPRRIERVGIRVDGLEGIRYSDGDDDIGEGKAAISGVGGSAGDDARADAPPELPCMLVIANVAVEPLALLLCRELATRGLATRWGGRSRSCVKGGGSVGVA